MGQIHDRMVAAATISNEAAESLVKAALEASVGAGIVMSVAVVDAGGALKSFARSDGAAPMTADVDRRDQRVPDACVQPHRRRPEVSPLSQLPRMMAISGGLSHTRERPVDRRDRHVGRRRRAGPQGGDERPACSRSLRRKLSEGASTDHALFRSLFRHHREAACPWTVSSW